MNGSSNGLTTTLLMFVPLLAVPFLAAFGIPDPGAAPSATVEEELPRTAMNAGVGHSLRHSADDLFQPMVHSVAVDLSSSQSTRRRPADRVRNAALPVEDESPWVNPFHAAPEMADAAQDVGAHRREEKHAALPRENSPIEQPDIAAFEPQPPPPGSRQLREVSAEVIEPKAFESQSRPFAASPRPAPSIAPGDPFLARVASETPRPSGGSFDGSRTLFNEQPAATPPRREPARPNPPAETREQNTGGNFNWKVAEAKLTELGARNFRWRRGVVSGNYHFSCLYSPREGSPRVTRRFEAESADPVEAVQNVMAQIEQSLPRS